MYALLAILISFCPQRVDEIVSTALREKYSEKMANMARGFVAIALKVGSQLTHITEILLLWKSYSASAALNSFPLLSPALTMNRNPT